MQFSSFSAVFVFLSKLFIIYKRSFCMASESLFAKLYYAIEDVYYSFMSAANKVLPVYKYFVIPVEKSGIPSMVAFVFLLAFLGGAGFVYSNYGGDLASASQGIFSGLTLPDFFLQGDSVPRAGSLTISVEDSKGRLVNGAEVSLFLAEKLLATGNTFGGDALFQNVPAKKLSYAVSKDGFKKVDGVADASKKRIIIVTLQCLDSGCPAGATARPSPTATATPTPTVYSPTTATPLPFDTRTLRVSLFDAATGAAISKSATVTVKDAIDLHPLRTADTSNGVAQLAGLIVGARVIVQADAEGYSRQDTGAEPVTLSSSVFDSGIELHLSRSAGVARSTSISVANESGSGLSIANVSVFEQGTALPFSVGQTNANGSLQVNLVDSKSWFILVTKQGYVDYASPIFNGGISQSVVMRALVNTTLQYCRVEASGVEVGVNEPVSITLIYANLTAPPSNVTLFCGTDAGQQVSVSTCLNTSGNCTAQCSYSAPGSKAIYAQMGDLNCRSTPLIAINVTTRGPYCSIVLQPQSIAANGSTAVSISYRNLSAAPVNDILLVNCGAGGAGNVVEARNCTGTTGSCTTICRYNFAPSQVLDNPTRPVFVSYGGAQCISDVRFADTASSLEASVIFRSKLLSNSRVALYKVIAGQPAPVFYAAASAAGGKAFFGQLVRGDSFAVKASDSSGILSGVANTVLDLPVNSLNVSVSLPAGYFNATAVDALTRATTAKLSSANVVFSAFCNDVTDDGSGFTRVFLPKGTCTALNGSCVLPSSAFVSCYVNGTAPNFIDSTGVSSYKVNDANGTLALQRLFSSCGGKNEACCANSCSSGLTCSRSVCVDSTAPTEQFSLSGSSGVISSNVGEVVFRVDAVFAADAVPFSISLDSLSCSGLTAEISGDSGVVPCFNDLARQPTPSFLAFDSAAPGCLVRSSGLSMPNAQATLSLSCAGATQKTVVSLRVVGSYSQDAAQYSPAVIAASSAASLFYLSSQKQRESQLLEVARGQVAPSDATDSQPPTVSILEPSTGSIVTGPVQILASASDDRRVDSVSFFLDGASIPFKVATAPPFSAVWDPSLASVPAGTHSIRVEAKDPSGNSASDSITVSKRAETTVASGIKGLNNLLLDSGKLYYAYSSGIGIISPSCPSGCVFADWRYPLQPVVPFVAGAFSSQAFFLAYQNSSTGASSVGVRVPVGGSPDFTISNLSNGISAPFVFADSSNAYFHSGLSLLKSGGLNVSAFGDLPAAPNGFGFDANAVYVSYNTPTGGVISKKAYSTQGTAFTTLTSPSSSVGSLAAKDGWVYWLEQSPGRVCKILATGAGAPSCSPAQLSHPSSLAIDPDGNVLFFLDGSSIKRVATDWSGYATLATGLSSPKSITVDSSSVFVSAVDSSGSGVIKKVPSAP